MLRRIGRHRGGLNRAERETAMAWIEKLQRANEPAVRPDEPWAGAVARALPGGISAISTAAIFDLLDMPLTTGNARRLAAAMRALGFVPIKSRRLVPGGFRDSTIRGWARPVREPKRSASATELNAKGEHHVRA
jgi:hypothetical protein